MSAPYYLYGSHASYYSAKTRAYLRKKGIAFAERLPSHDRFRTHVRPASGSHRIPQVEMPDGVVLQDSTEIFDALEQRHPAIPAFPHGPRLKLLAHLMELFASEGLVTLAWQYRWFYEGNFPFVTMDFGRSFKPSGSDEELAHYGGIIADRMKSRRPFNPSPEKLQEMETSYLGLLSTLERHFRFHPYLLGNHPSIADYAIMGALYAHMGRDPVPRTVMQAHAPRVTRWVEHMNTPEIHSPEFPEFDIAYPADDLPAETLLPVLKHLFDEHAVRMMSQCLGYNAHVAKGTLTPGAVISAELDQPILDPVSIEVRGRTRDVSVAVQNVWLYQRALAHVASLSEIDKASCGDMLAQCGGLDLISFDIAHPPVRRDNRFWCN
jgi:glutathione S-transferase